MSSANATKNKKTRVAHIVAAAKNGVIGNKGKLPWNIPEDMKWFRERTRGCALIMGRKTFEAVEHPLPKRLNVVITRQKNYKPKEPGDSQTPVVIVSDLDAAIKYCKNAADKWKNEIFIIGGGEIYHQSVNLVDTIYLTRIHKNFEGDATYSDPDPKIFKCAEKIDRQEPIPFTFETWVRKD